MVLAMNALPFDQSIYVVDTGLARWAHNLAVMRNANGFQVNNKNRNPRFAPLENSFYPEDCSMHHTRDQTSN
jgi:hypothetical protein